MGRRRKEEGLGREEEERGVGGGGPGERKEGGEEGREGMAKKREKGTRSDFLCLR